MKVIHSDVFRGDCQCILVYLPIYQLTIIFLIVAFILCHSKKNIASSVSANANTIPTIVIELGSFNIIAEPIIITPCRDSVATRSAVIAYRYRIKANSATDKGEKKAVSRYVDDTLQ